MRGEGAAVATALSTPDLRDGAWTRFGTGAGLGDPVTEQVLDGLAASTRAAARAQGYAAGWAEGRREAAAEQARVQAELAAEAEAGERRRDAQVSAAVQALTAAAQQLQQQAAAVAADVEDQALRLARELTALLLDREVRTAEDPTGDLARRVLAVLPSGVPATVRVHPAVAAALAAHPDVAPLAERGVGVAGDHGLGPADAVVETDRSAVDLRVTAALARVQEALS